MQSVKNFLPWLASWLALVLDDKWPTEKKRELVKKAHRLFNKRGTPEGLKEILEIYIGHNSKANIQIIEHFKKRRWLVFGKETILGCNSFLWGLEGALGNSSKIGCFYLSNAEAPSITPFNMYAYKFSLILPTSYCNTDEKERTIRRIVELWKPAYTQFFLVKVIPK